MSGWLTGDRGSGSGHQNPETLWAKRIKDCVAFNSLRLFSACPQVGTFTFFLLKPLSESILSPKNVRYELKDSNLV